MINSTTTGLVISTNWLCPAFCVPSANRAVSKEDMTLRGKTGYVRAKRKLEVIHLPFRYVVIIVAPFESQSPRFVREALSGLVIPFWWYVEGKIAW